MCCSIPCCNKLVCFSQKFCNCQTYRSEAKKVGSWLCSNTKNGKLSERDEHTSLLHVSISLCISYGDEKFYSAGQWNSVVPCIELKWSVEILSKKFCNFHTKSLILCCCNRQFVNCGCQFKPFYCFNFKFFFVKLLFLICHASLCEIMLQKYTRLTGWPKWPIFQ